MACQKQPPNSQYNLGSPASKKPPYYLPVETGNAPAVRHGACELSPVSAQKPSDHIFANCRSREYDVQSLSTSSNQNQCTDFLQSTVFVLPCTLMVWIGLRQADEQETCLEQTGYYYIQAPFATEKTSKWQRNSAD